MISVAHPDAARAGGVAVLVEDRLASHVTDRLDIFDRRRPLINDDGGRGGAGRAPAAPPMPRTAPPSGRAATAEPASPADAGVAEPATSGAPIGSAASIPTNLV